MLVAHLTLNTSTLQSAANQSNLGTIGGGEESFHNVTIALSPNVKVSEGSHPPMTFDSSLSESAGSASLDRLVRCPLLPCPKAQSAACPRQGPRETSLGIRLAARRIPNG